MFESNFPVDKISCSYAVLWNAFKKIAARFNDAEKARLFSQTAAEVYRVKLNGAELRDDVLRECLDIVFGGHRRRRA